jgi:hemerythrin-like domain-containing protein
MTTQFTKVEANAIELIKSGASFNGKVYQSRKGAQVYVKNMSFNIQRENAEYFENLKKNYSLGFAVNMNNSSDVRRAERLGYDAIEG